MTADLAAWLTRIWDEEEKQAYRAAGGKEYPGPDWTLSEDVIGYPSGYVACGAYGGGIKQEIGEFIVAHDPASVLARIAADRKILAAYQETAPPYATADQQITHDVLEDVLRLKAEQYADRSGYREEWRP